MGYIDITFELQGGLVAFLLGGLVRQVRLARKPSAPVNDCPRVSPVSDTTNKVDARDVGDLKIIFLL